MEKHDIFVCRRKETDSALFLWTNLFKKIIFVGIEGNALQVYDFTYFLTNWTFDPQTRPNLHSAHIPEEKFAKEPPCSLFILFFHLTKFIVNFSTGCRKMMQIVWKAKKKKKNL